MFQAVAITLVWRKEGYEGLNCSWWIWLDVYDRTWICIFLNSLKHLVQLVEDGVIGRATAAMLLRSDLVEVEVHVHLERLSHLWEIERFPQIKYLRPGNLLNSFDKDSLMKMMPTRAAKASSVNLTQKILSDLFLLSQHYPTLWNIWQWPNHPQLQWSYRRTTPKAQSRVASWDNRYLC